MAKNDKKYRVGKSKIQGDGAFAKQTLNPGDYIGKVHTINKLYEDYDFTELGKKHNHSEDPNVQNVLIGNERHLVAIKPIKKGQELTSDYRLQPDLEQPNQDFEKAKGGKKLTSSKAKEILHDKSVHGQPLTDKQRKFFGAVASGYIKAETGGWLDTYNAPQAQNGIEGTMGGLTDKGFNYNPAWGGAWQNGGILQPPMAGAMQSLPLYQTGGSLPGATGMMYARTAGAAPSEGPYAKKTLPSAQNGGEEPSSLELAKIKAKMALESHFGNPSARRMTTPYPQDLVFKLDAGPDKGKMGRGTHWMGTIDNYAVPNIQEGEDGKLFFNKNASPFDREAMRFDSPEDALMFAENYKRVAPMMRNNFQNGGMAYYQAGLDFKPKTISRDGSSVNRADEYPLEKLDNLLNFTNYNKPKAKSGGWLDKYN